jgi:hypothetical protein
MVVTPDVATVAIVVLVGAACALWAIRTAEADLTERSRTGAGWATGALSDAVCDAVLVPRPGFEPG